jgi:hypothetical protein
VPLVAVRRRDLSTVELNVVAVALSGAVDYGKHHNLIAVLMNFINNDVGMFD